MNKRHPVGLWVLFTTEMWERFAFYLMRAIFVLYLVDVSTNESTPGFGWSEADAYRLYGIYTSLVYFLPLLGGWVADRFLGQRRCVLLGGMMMALGEFCLAATEFVRIGNGVKVTWQTDPAALVMFYAGLGLMILGNGFFKPCISVMVGQLYAPGDKMRDSAFSIFYMGINIGAFFSPLVAGSIAEKYGYHYGFIIAGLGMIFGLITFSFFGAACLKGIGTPPAKQDTNAERTPEEKAVKEKAIYEQTRPLVKEDWDRMYVILVLSLFVIAFWVSFEQAGSSLNIFAKSKTDRAVADLVIRVTPNAVSKNLYLNNEDVVDFQATVIRTQALADQLERLGNEVVRESLGDRLKRLFSFKVSKDNRTMEELVPALQQQATDLTQRLQDTSDEDARNAVEQMNRKKKTAESSYSPGQTALTFPTTWYQSVNAFGIVIFAPIFTAIWLFLASRGMEPSTPTKFALGLLLLSLGFFLMIPGAREAATQGKAAAHWLIWCYLFSTWGELCLSPIGLSMITKLAPARYASLFMGVWFMASSIAYLLAGELARMFGSGEGVNLIFGKEGGLADFFLLMAIIPLVIGVIALAMAPSLKKKMHGIL
ncbi:MAG: peptide MFS transporter [Planctomycetaceae bacterium]|nr:peptide MFS transporter [Planctomycetaceae bacterium]